MSIPIFHTADSADVQRLEALRSRLSLRSLLLENLDAAAPESRVGQVRQIIRDVRDQGDAAVFEYTERFDHVVLPEGRMRVPPEAIDQAYRDCSPELLAALDVAIANVRRYQLAMLPVAPAAIALGDAAADSPGAPGMLGVRYEPLDRVGIYVPGGAAAYPSTVIMTVVPAQTAGVKDICLCSPMRKGHVAPEVLAAADKLGVKEIYGIGGVQAVAAMALGTGTIRPVDKIVGPGNLYVQLAKRELYGIVDIDSFAGPSEVVVLADDSADPAVVAAELLAQAEHAPGSCIGIMASQALAVAIQTAMEEQLGNLSRAAMTREALGFASALVVTASHREAVELADLFAPEHLQITTRHAADDAAAIRHAGAIFIGPYSPVAAGDYLAGPSHVLPTSGTARYFSGLSAESFRRRIGVVQLDRPALQGWAQAVVALATAEGFDAHARSVEIRLRQGEALR